MSSLLDTWPCRHTSQENQREKERGGERGERGERGEGRGEVRKRIAG